MTLSPFLARVARRYSLALVRVCLALGITTAAIEATAAELLPTAMQGVAQPLTANIETAIGLRIQQTISALPPTSPQGVSYEYDATTDTLVRSDQVATTAFLAPQTIPAGELSLRVGVSYFDLRPLDQAVDYSIEPAFKTSTFPPVVSKFGVDADAKAEILALAASYGIADAVELDITVPLAFVTADATFVYSAAKRPTTSPSSPFFDIFGADSARQLDDELLAGGKAFLRTAAHQDLGVSGLDGSTDVGLGRINLGVKAEVLKRAAIQVAFVPSLFFPSPNSEELAGSDSTSLYPRVVAAVPVNSSLQAYLDLGYEHDFDQQALCRLAWNAGLSLASSLASIDLGMGGSDYNSAIRLFPTQVNASVPARFNIPYNRLTFTSLNNPELQTNLVNIVLGTKVRILRNVFVAGMVTIPVVNVEFSPDAIGTISAEVSF